MFHLLNSQVFIIRMSRQDFQKCKNNGALNLAGVYIIYSTTSLNSGIYIGEGDNVCARIKYHDANKSFWDEVIIFSSDRMNIAYAKNIEYQFIKRAKLSSKYPLYNGVGGGRRKLGREDKEHLNKHLEEYYEIISKFNIDIFDLRPDVIYKYDRWGSDVKVIITDVDKRKVKVLSGSIVGNGCSTRRGMEDVDYIDLPGGGYQTKTDVDLELPEEYPYIFSKMGAGLFKNENGISLNAVLNSTLG